MTVDPQEFGEDVGPPPITYATKLSDVVRLVNAHGLALDQVVIVAESCDGCAGEPYLDWAKNYADYENGKKLTDDEKLLTPEEREALREELARQEAERVAEAERREQEAEETMRDNLAGW